VINIVYKNGACNIYDNELSPQGNWTLIKTCI
jgi:hypothetical protein